eukprot:scaffold14865_cov114-Skeletonema_dohrnii-CCMP3373.AAC.6
MKQECKTKVDKQKLGWIASLHTPCDIKSSDHDEKLHPFAQNRIATPRSKTKHVDQKEWVILVEICPVRESNPGRRNHNAKY